MVPITQPEKPKQPSWEEYSTLMCLYSQSVKMWRELHGINNQQHANIDNLQQQIEALQKQIKEITDAFNKNEGLNKALKKTIKKKDQVIKGLNAEKMELKYQYMQDTEALDLKRCLAENTNKDQKSKIARLEFCYDIQSKKMEGMQEKIKDANKAEAYAIDLLNSEEGKFNLMMGTTKAFHEKDKKNKKQANQIAFLEEKLGVIVVDELDN